MWLGSNRFSDLPYFETCTRLLRPRGSPNVWIIEHSIYKEFEAGMLLFTSEKACVCRELCTWAVLGHCESLVTVCITCSVVETCSLETFSYIIKHLGRRFPQLKELSHRCNLLSSIEYIVNPRVTYSSLRTPPVSLQSSA